MSDIDWQKDVEQVAPGGTIKERLARLVAEYADAASKLSEAEDELEAAKERMSEIKLTLIPEVMAEFGMDEIKLEDKTKIKVESKVNASIKKENEQVAFDWLIENDFGGLIKSSITAEFDREEIDHAREVCERLVEDGVDASLKQGVHAATVKSFAKERLEAGETLPECFSVFEYKEAKITLPKAKK